MIEENGYRSNQIDLEHTAKAQWFEVTLNDKNVVDVLEGHLRQAEPKVPPQGKRPSRVASESASICTKTSVTPVHDNSTCEGEPPLTLTPPHWTKAGHHRNAIKTATSPTTTTRSSSVPATARTSTSASGPAIRHRQENQSQAPPRRLEALRLYFEVTRPSRHPDQGTYNATAIGLVGGLEIPNYTSPLPWYAKSKRHRTAGAYGSRSPYATPVLTRPRKSYAVSTASASGLERTITSGTTAS